MQFLERISTRAVDRDQPAALAAITQPTLVAAGSSWATVGLHPR